MPRGGGDSEALGESGAGILSVVVKRGFIAASVSASRHHLEALATSMTPNLVKQQRESTAIQDDGAKVTMQTRVAVRDKTPHRFQVIPLREILKRPSQTQASVSLPASPHASGRLSSHNPNARRSNTKNLSAGHSSPDASTPDTSNARSLVLAQERVALQNLDLNTDPSKSAHKKTISLEFGRRFKESPNPAEQSPTFSSSRGFSQSLNQYSFRLKPWKSFTNLHTTPSRAKTVNRHGDKPTDDLVGVCNLWGTSRAGDAFACSDLETTPSSGYHLGQDISHSGAYSMGQSTTLNESVGQLSMANKALEQGSKKRHAIYSHMGILPISYGESKDESESESPSGLNRSLPVPRDSRRATLQTVSHQSYSGMVSNRYASDPLPRTPPLKLARKAAPRCRTDPTQGAVCYPKIVLELFRELDDAIEGWRDASR
ncbi:hypothetical protein NMY22_g12061 [Coprinellus aureogranulatus]|nr:hypothetical protein NMY22_g12061 [Coprinellus aureogranulatus]